MSIQLNRNYIITIINRTIMEYTKQLYRLLCFIVVLPCILKMPMPLKSQNYLLLYCIGALTTSECHIRNQVLL